MPLPFSLPQRPSLPSITAWTTSPKPDDQDPATPTPQSAPPRASHSSSNTSSSITKRLSSRSIRHTSLVVSRPTTPAKASPLSATFGLPVEEDDDPFGVRALEQAGLMIKEAGTKENHRPGSDAFQYRPSPNSPIWRSSMASAMSKNSRPSLDGRASVMTGRPSFAHSRQSSISEIGTQTDSDALDGGSLRAMSPVRETGQSTRTSPEDSRKPSPKSKSRFGVPGERPPPLKLQQSIGDRRKNEDTSPRTRLSAVQEKVREIEREQQAREAKAKEIKTADTDAGESDLDRLAREIREMAQEHEDEERLSEEESMKSEEESRKSEESQEINASTRLEGLTEQVLETKAEASKNVQPQTHDAATRNSKRKSKRSSTIVPEIKPLTVATLPEHVDEGDENEEEDDEDDDDEDYDSFDDEEEAVIIEEVVLAAAPVNFRPRNLGVQSLQARAQVVSIHMPPPPAIPSRNPRRARNSEIPNGGDSKPVSPGVAENVSTRSTRDSITPEPIMVVSKPASLHSIPDNDSSSSYSLGNERDSFAEANIDIMSQTSHGSVDTTPTKAKATDVDFVSIDQHLNDDAVLGPEREIGPDITVISKLTPSPEEVSPALSRNEDQAAIPQQAEGQDKILDVPAVPERRRPFSFEVAAGGESFNSPSIESTLQEGEQQNTIAKGEATTQEEADTGRSSIKPIVIPALAEDDESEYEEDFS